MNAVLDRYNKKSGRSLEEIIYELGRLSANPGATIIMEMLESEKAYITDDVIERPRIGDPDVRKDIPFRLGEASGIKKIIEAIRAASDYMKSKDAL